MSTDNINAVSEQAANGAIRYIIGKSVVNSANIVSTTDSQNDRHK